MLFLDSWFWVFVAAAIPAFWICPPPVKLWWLLIASVIFQYHFAGPAGMAPIFGLAAVTYFVGLGARGRWGRRLFIAACALLVLALAFYKYSAFSLQTAASALKLVNLGVPHWVDGWRTPIAPLGISFFTFEFVHYLYEIRVHGRDPVRNPLHFCIFALFFPTLAAGPIKRFPDFVPQLDGLRNPSLSTVWPATQRIIRGMFKKVCIADLLVEYIKVFEAVPHHNMPTVGALAVLQGFRIYYDFAGYSDMAIGLGQLVGLRVPENFDRPYFSTTLQEFWRRWHMSLSSWIRDYVYIPLGGNRAHRLFNLLAAMILCGLWHGAKWHFAAWGAFHGTGLAVETAVRRWRPGLFAPTRGRRLLGWAICYTYVTYGWLLFFYPLDVVYKMTTEAFWWRCAF